MLLFDLVTLSAFINTNSFYYYEEIYTITGNPNGYHCVCTISLRFD